MDRDKELNEFRVIVLDVVGDMKQVLEKVDLQTNLINLMMEMFKVLHSSKMMDIPGKKKDRERFNFLFEEAKTYWHKYKQLDPEAL